MSDTTPPPLTDEELKAIRERVAERMRLTADDSWCWMGTPASAAFIDHEFEFPAEEDIASLLAEVDRLRGEMAHREMLIADLSQVGRNAEAYHAGVREGLARAVRMATTAAKERQDRRSEVATTSANDFLDEADTITFLAKLLGEQVKAVEEEAAT